ncbi:MAG TPA: holo-[acyl-carrier-protein] synthase [Candidatus Acetothermia bacterium]|nr:holo-[acyl-carrier-protein] synthase [Candidatus Acetothermia bacterium]
MTGVGIDIVDVERIRQLHERHGERFLKRVFTDTEIEYALRARGNRIYEHLAARFAVKEAVIKALGRAVPFRSIEVVNSSSGRPIVMCAFAHGKIEASLSHTDRLAIAYVLNEGE